MFLFLLFLAAFEVASIRPSVPRPVAQARTAGGLGCPQSLRIDAGQAAFQCATLPMLIGYAYRISPDRIQGPPWMTATHFDILAKLPAGAPRSQVPDMMQTLLAGRFQLTLHRATATREAFALVPLKTGLKAEKAPGGTPEDASAEGEYFGSIQTRTGPDATTFLSNPNMGSVLQTDGPNRSQRWDAPATTMQGLAELLDKVMPLSAPIVDMTGIQGRYMVAFEITLREAAGIEDLEHSVVQAFNDGLRKVGLELQRRKAPVEILVVDTLQKTPTAN
jgi:uncharacterized protein (TIGR03435 family)